MTRGRRRRSGPAPTSASNVPIDELRREFDAIVLAGGSTAPRDLPVPGPRAEGIHFAMEYLTLQNRAQRRRHDPDDEFITRARTSTSIIIGGGDTGADCLGTAHRQGARSVHQLELLPRPPDTRAPSNPWPLWPNIFRVSSAHEEGGERLYAIATERFTGDATDGHDAARARVEMVNADGRLEFTPVAGSEFELEGRPRAAGDGLPRPGAQRHARRARRADDRARQRLARRATG